MPQLLQFPLTKTTLDNKQARNKAETLLQNMDRDCFNGEDGHYDCSLVMRQGANDNTTGHCLYLLVEGNTLLSSALITNGSQVTFRWTPPSQRKKGYAQQILLHLEVLWEKCCASRPLWVSSYPYMEKSNAKAGWVKFPHPNRDGTQDWTPPQLLDRYTRQWHRMEEGRKQGLEGFSAQVQKGLYTKEELEQFSVDYIKLVTMNLVYNDLNDLDSLCKRIKKLKF